MNKCKKLLVLICIALILFLAVGVPVIINWLYSLPPIFFTQWSAADILGYYGTLLGAAAGIITLYYTIRFDLWQLRLEHHYQREAKMWEDMDAMFRQCLDDIHPSKLELALFIAISNENPYELLTQTLTFRVTVMTSVDRLVSSVKNVSDAGLQDLVEQLISFKNKLLQIEQRYSTLQKRTIQDGFKSRSFLFRSHKNLDERTFGKEREIIADQIQTLYDTDYRNLLTSREDFFRKKHDEIAAKSNKNKFQIFSASEEGSH